MTLVVAVSRARDFAVMTGDRSVYHIDDQGGLHVQPPLKVPKPKAITSRVLAATGGDVAIGEDFLNRLGVRVAGNDDLAVCHAAAIEVVAELDRDDEQLAGMTVWSTGREDYTVRGSIHGDDVGSGWNMILCGFHEDGRTGVVQCSETTFEDYADEATGEMSFGLPWGLPIEEFVPYAEEFYGAGGCANLEDALMFAYSIHRRVGQQHDDRVTRETDVAVLRWRDGAVLPLEEFTVDRGDLVGLLQSAAGVAALL